MQLTPEQRRLASLMNDKIDVNDIEKKINKIMELTGSSKDKAIVALHDCANELDKAIDMILEGELVDDNEWKSQQRKKKPKASASFGAGNKENSGDVSGGRHLNGDSRRGKRDGGQRGDRSNRGKFDKFDNNSGGRRFAGKDSNNWSSQSNNDTSSVFTTPAVTETTDTNFLPGEDDWGEAAGASAVDFTSSNEAPVTESSDFTTTKPRPSNNYQSKSGSRFNNDRQPSRGSYAGKASASNNRGSSGRTYQNKNYKETESTFGNTGDTWGSDLNENSNADSGNQMSTWADSNVNDAISDDDWNANSVQTKVFTSSRTTEEPAEQPRKPNMAEIVSGIRPKPTAAAIVKGIASSSEANKNILSNSNVKISEPAIIPSNVATNSTSVIPSQSSESTGNQSSIVDHSLSHADTTKSSAPEQTNKMDLSALLTSPSSQSKSAASQSSAPTSHSSTSNPSSLNALPSSGHLASHQTNSAGAALLQQLTQQQESAPSGYRSIDYTKQASDTIKILDRIAGNETVNSSAQFTSSNGALLEQQSARHANASVRPSQPRISSRRTKIPDSAVEMPNTDHISQLNVQFGALDFSSDSYLSESSATTNPVVSTAPVTSFNELQPPKPPTQSKLPTNQSVNQSQATAHAAVAQANLNQMLNQVQQSEQSSYPKPTPSQELNQMASQLVGSQQLTDSVLERSKPNPPPGSSGPSHHYSNKPAGLYNQQGPGGDSAVNQMYSKYNSDANSAAVHYGGGYGQTHSNYGYSNNQQSSGYGVNSSTGNVGGNSYGGYGASSISNQSNNAPNGAHQKLNLKDLENASGANALSSQSLGLVSNSTVTTNVLKNTLSATGKAGNLGPNVAPNVNPLLGTPQYVISQPGLSAFYPIYDMPMAGREHNFGSYAPQQGGPNNAPNEPKYGNRNDPSDSNAVVQSNQAPVTQPTGPMFGQFPPHYGFFYTGVNMMPQSLYQATAPFLQVQPPNPAAAAAAASAGPNAHNQGPAAVAAAAAAAAGFNKPQSQPAYGSHSAFSNYGLSQMQAHGGQDYGAKAYGNSGADSGNSQQVSQSGNSSGPSGSSKQNVTSGGNDLSQTANMYAKSHAQLTKVRSNRIHTYC
jgi:hypothetical protein